MNLIKELNNIESKNILVIGDVMIDKYYFGDSKRISPEAPVPILLKKKEKVVLGGAANVAINIKEAKQQVSLLSVIGADNNGEMLLDILKKNNIDSSFIIKDKKRCTTVKNRFIGQNNVQMFRADEEIVEPLENEENKRIYEILEKNISKFDILVISDYNKGVLTVANTAKIIDIANKNKVKTLVDVKEPKYEKYKNAFLIKPNLTELQDITKMKVDTEDEILMASKELLIKTNCKYVLTTRGKDGMTLIGNKIQKHEKCLSKEVYDVTGAGDTVISYLAVGLSNNIELLNTIQIANYAAGVGVSKMGTYAVKIEEIQRYIEDETKEEYKSKIVTVDKLNDLIKDRKNKKVVFTNGCFDILHVGHTRYLEKAAELGDILIVGINSDNSVKRLKGESRPIVPEKERMELLAALESVKYVVKFEEDTPYNIISKIKPDIITKGGDYNKEYVVGKDIVESYGGRVEICEFIESRSTTNIINRIKGEKS